MTATDTTTSDRIAGAWRFDPIHSAASFTVSYLVAPFRAEFTRMEAHLVDGQLTGNVDVASIALKDDHFAAQVLGDDFFAADRHPQITFRSTDLMIAGDDVVVDGELTMKGVTRPVRATGMIAGPQADFMGHTRLGLSLTAMIERGAYGLRWNAELPDGGRALAEDVVLQVELEFIQGG